MLSITLGMMASPIFAAPSQTDHYVVTTHGRAMGTMDVRSYESADGTITEVENINKLLRAGEPFDSVSRMRFVERGEHPVAFSYKLALGEQELT